MKPSRVAWQAGVFALALFLSPVFVTGALAGANPGFAFYGYGEIVPNPNPAIMGENTHFTLTVTNLGDAVATHVQVQIAFNDWGVTFMGWQPFGTATIASIAPGGTATAEFDHVFLNRAHTCIEALVLGADQDDNLLDNRGQINMEVINSGETFGYNVPLVNNGAGDLNLQVFGHAGGANGTVPREVKAKPIDKQIVVHEGETVEVPVEIEFPPDTPPGTVVDYVLNAFDLAHPGDNAAINHVILRVVFNSAKGLKQGVLVRLNGLPPGVPAKALKVKVEEIKKHVIGSLDPSLWKDGFRLRKGAAGRVFAAEKDAVKKLIDLLDSKDVPLTWKTELDASARALTDAERILAQTAIKDSGGNAEAEADLVAADKLRAAGKYIEAVKAYGHILIDLD